MCDFTPYQTRLNLVVQIAGEEISSFIKTSLRKTANVADEGIRIDSEIFTDCWS